MSSGYDDIKKKDNGLATVRLEQVSLRFRKYSDRNPTLKKAVLNALFHRPRPEDKSFALYDQLDLAINHGDRLGIIGSNGAGKSTLLKLICGVYRPSQGTLRIRGRIAPIIELGAGFNFEMTGLENIFLNGALLGFGPKEMAAKKDRILDFAGLTEAAATPVKYYSTGMLLRLAFSIATDVEPEILLVDEVFAAGDAEFVERAKERMRQLIDSSHIVCLVSHDMDLIRQICNRVIWLAHGKVVQDGETNRICDAYLKHSTGK